MFPGFDMVKRWEKFFLNLVNVVLSWIRNGLVIEGKTNGDIKVLYISPYAQRWELAMR